MCTSCTGQVRQAVLALDFGQQPVRHIGVDFQLHPEPQRKFTRCGMGGESLAIVGGNPEVKARTLEEDSLWMLLVEVKVQNT